MTRAKMPHSTALFSRKLVAISWNLEDSHMATSSSPTPRSTRPELLLRTIHSSL